MRLLLALRDVKTGSFLAPMTANTPGEAERIYGDLISNGPALIVQHAKDFPLYEIGRYDEQTGEVYALANEDGTRSLPRLLLESGQLLQLVKEA